MAARGVVRLPPGGSIGAAASGAGAPVVGELLVNLGLKLCRVGGVEEDSSTYSAPYPAGPPSRSPPHPRLRLRPAPRLTAAPSSCSWCSGAAELCVAVSMARDPSAKVRESGGADGGGAWAEVGAGRARPCPHPFHPPSWARPFPPPSPPVPHKGCRGARARPPAARGADLGTWVGDRCRAGAAWRTVFSGSGSRLLMSGGIEGELVLELQQ